jgi:hypothetical protein
MALLQKLKIPLLILLLLSGLGFVIFAVFFNHATLHITAEAPFSVQILNLRTVDCPQTDCAITVAPGSYQIALNKPDYKTIQDAIDLKLGEDVQKSYHFELIPKIQPIGDWNSGKDFNQKPYLLESLKRVDLTQPASFWPLLDNSLVNFPTIQNFQIASSGNNYLLDDSKNVDLIELQQSTPEVTPIPSGQAYFYTPDNSRVIYLADDQDTLEQTLYSLRLDALPLAPQPLTTFLRKISTYQLIPNRAFTRIALLDQSNADQVGLYVVDLQNKTRKLIVSEPNIVAFKWLENDFLNDNSQTAPTPATAPSASPIAPPAAATPPPSSASPANSIATPSFLIQKRNPVTFKTELYRGSIDQPTLDLSPVTNDLSDVLIVDSNQLIYTSAFGDPTTATNGFTFQKINLDTGNSETLFTANDLAEPTKIQYDPAGKRLLFLSGDTIYSLSLTL